ncbi:MAG TPA: transposase [Vicinamibacteria bacterium]|nr:transposase [Vicinamibacteria bacterium]
MDLLPHATHARAALRRFWTYRSTTRAGGPLRQWRWRASHSRPEPFKNLARMLRALLDGVLVWTTLRISYGALEGRNNKVTVISHRAYGYRTAWTYMANVRVGPTNVPRIDSSSRERAPDSPE